MIRIDTLLFDTVRCFDDMTVTAGEVQRGAG